MMVELIDPTLDQFIDACVKPHRYTPIKVKYTNSSPSYNVSGKEIHLPNKPTHSVFSTGDVVLHLSDLADLATISVTAKKIIVHTNRISGIPYYNSDKLKIIINTNQLMEVEDEGVSFTIVLGNCNLNRIPEIIKYVWGGKGRYSVKSPIGYFLYEEEDDEVSGDGSGGSGGSSGNSGNGNDNDNGSVGMVSFIVYTMQDVTSYVMNIPGIKVNITYM
jgi:hypothetical protein